MNTEKDISISSAASNPTQDYNIRFKEITDSITISTGNSTHSYTIDDTVKTAVPSVSVVYSDGTTTDLNYTFELDTANNAVDISIANQTGGQITVDINLYLYYITPQ